MEETYYAFVPHDEAAVWAWFGWRVCAELGYYHGQYSVLMERRH